MAQKKIIGDQIDQTTLNPDNFLPSQGGNSGKFLKTNGTTTSWDTPAGSGTVTSVDVSGGTTGLTFSGGPVTTSGTITMAGTLDETNGGTNQTTYATGDILYASGANTLSKLAAGSDTNVLTLASGVPTWAAPAAGGSVYWKDPVRVATTANGTLATAFENGDVIDNVTLVTGDRILIKNQSTSADNGIYTVNASGAPTRATDADTNAELQRGVAVYVQLGNANGGQVWQLMASNANPIVVGTNTQVWVPLNGVVVRGLNATTAPIATGSSSLAIGASSTCGSATSCVAIGPSADASGGNSGVAIGSSATTTSGVSIGNSAQAAGSSGNVCVGPSTTAFNAGVAVGNGASAGANSFSARNIALGASTVSGTNPRVTSDSIAIGNAATISTSGSSVDLNSSIAIGEDTSIVGHSAAIALGYSAKTDFHGEINISNAGFANAGDIHNSHFPMYIVTSNATPTELATSIGTRTTTPTGVIVLTNNSTYIFDCDIVARKSTTGTDYSAWNLKFCINREANAASTALVGSITKTVIGQTAGASTWDVTATADTTNGRPNISVTGEAATTIRWVANIRMTKVSG